jgi:hypothetical protein
MIFGKPGSGKRDASWSGHGRCGARALRRRLRRLGTCARATAASSGVKEWSDAQIARLRPRWIRDFQRRHMIRCAFLALLYLLGLAFLGASVERFWHWVQTHEAVAGAAIRTVDQWKARCIVQPWSRGCKPGASSATRPTRVQLGPGTPARDAVSGVHGNL